MFFCTAVDLLCGQWREISPCPLSTLGIKLVVLLGLWRPEVRTEKCSEDFGATKTLVCILKPDIFSCLSKVALLYVMQRMARNKALP